MRRSKGVRLIAGILAFIYFHSNIVFAHTQESNFWSDRKTATQKFKQTGTPDHSLRNSSPIPSEILSQLPRPSAMDIDFRDFKGAPLPWSEPRGKSPLPNNPLKTPDPLHSFQSRIAQSIQSYGTIQEIYLSTSTKAPWVIHIQDAHGVEEAQRNIAHLIDVLHTEDGFNLIGLEGAKGGFVIDPFRNFPDPNITKLIAEKLLKNGHIGGPEFMGLTVPSVPLLWGIEDFSFYGKNIDALRSSLKHRDELLSILRDFQSSADQLKKSVYSSQLKEFDRAFNAYHQEGKGLGSYVRYLFQARGNENSEANDFPQTRQLLKALKHEDSLNFNQVEKERLLLMNDLTRKFSPQLTSELIEESLRYRQGLVSFENYYQFIRNISFQSGVPLEKYSQLNSYIQYVLIAERINRKNLIEELSHLELTVQDKLAAQPNERQLMQINNHLVLLNKLSKNEMTVSDWSTYKKSRNDILKIQDSLNNLFRTTRTLQQAPHNQTLLELVTPFEQFCEYALKRNSAMIESLLTKMHGEKTSLAVLVAGGFHSEGLTKILREQNIHHMVISPKISEAPRENHSLDVFARSPIPLDKLLSGERIYLSPPLQFARNHVSPNETKAAHFRQIQTLADQTVLQAPLGEKEIARYNPFIMKNAQMADLDFNLIKVSAQPFNKTIKFIANQQAYESHAVRVNDQWVVSTRLQEGRWQPWLRALQAKLNLVILKKLINQTKKIRFRQMVRMSHLSFSVWKKTLFEDIALISTGYLLWLLSATPLLPLIPIVFIGLHIKNAQGDLQQALSIGQNARDGFLATRTTVRRYFTSLIFGSSLLVVLLWAPAFFMTYWDVSSSALGSLIWIFSLGGIWAHRSYSDWTFHSGLERWGFAPLTISRSPPQKRKLSVFRDKNAPPEGWGWYQNIADGFFQTKWTNLLPVTHALFLLLQSLNKERDKPIRDMLLHAVIKKIDTCNDIDLNFIFQGITQAQNGNDSLPLEILSPLMVPLAKRLKNLQKEQLQYVVRFLIFVLKKIGENPSQEKEYVLKILSQQLMDSQGSALQDLTQGMGEGLDNLDTLPAEMADRLLPPLLERMEDAEDVSNRFLVRCIVSCLTKTPTVRPIHKDRFQSLLSKKLKDKASIEYLIPGMTSAFEKSKSIKGDIFGEIFILLSDEIATNPPRVRDQIIAALTEGVKQSDQLSSAQVDQLLKILTPQLRSAVGQFLTTTSFLIGLILRKTVGAPVPNTDPTLLAISEHLLHGSGETLENLGEDIILGLSKSKPLGAPLLKSISTNVQAFISLKSAVEFDHFCRGILKGLGGGHIQNPRNLNPILLPLFNHLPSAMGNAQLSLAEIANTVFHQQRALDPSTHQNIVRQVATKIESAQGKTLYYLSKALAFLQTDKTQRDALTDFLDQTRQTTLDRLVHQDPTNLHYFISGAISGGIKATADSKIVSFIQKEMSQVSPTATAYLIIGALQGMTSTPFTPTAKPLLDAIVEKVRTSNENDFLIIANLFYSSDLLKSCAVKDEFTPLNIAFVNRLAKVNFRTQKPLLEAILWTLTRTNNLATPLLIQYLRLLLPWINGESTNLHKPFLEIFSKAMENASDGDQMIPTDLLEGIASTYLTNLTPETTRPTVQGLLLGIATMDIIPESIANVKRQIFNTLSQAHFSRTFTPFLEALFSVIISEKRIPRPFLQELLMSVSEFKTSKPHEISDIIQKQLKNTQNISEGSQDELLLFLSTLRETSTSALQEFISKSIATVMERAHHVSNETTDTILRSLVLGHENPSGDGNLPTYIMAIRQIILFSDSTFPSRLATISKSLISASENRLLESNPIAPKDMAKLFEIYNRSSNWVFRNELLSRLIHHPSKELNGTAIRTLQNSDHFFASIDMLLRLLAQRQNLGFAVSKDEQTMLLNSFTQPHRAYDEANHFPQGIQQLSEIIDIDLLIPTMLQQIIEGRKIDSSFFQHLIYFYRTKPPHVIDQSTFIRAALKISDPNTEDLLVDMVMASDFQDLTATLLATKKYPLILKCLERRFKNPQKHDLPTTLSVAKNLLDALRETQTNNRFSSMSNIPPRDSLRFWNLFASHIRDFNYTDQNKIREMIPAVINDLLTETSDEDFLFSVINLLNLNTPMEQISHVFQKHFSDPQITQEDLTTRFNVQLNALPPSIVSFAHVELNKKVTEYPKAAKIVLYDIVGRTNSTNSLPLLINLFRQENDRWLKNKLARYIEIHHKTLVDLLDQIWGKPFSFKLAKYVPQLMEMPARGFASSPLANPHGAKDTLHFLRSAKRQLGAKTYDLISSSWRMPLHIGGIVFQNTPLETTPIDGYDVPTFVSANETRPQSKTGHSQYVLMRESLKNESQAQWGTKLFAFHNSFIESNFSALELIMRNNERMTKETVTAILKHTENMVKALVSLDPKKQTYLSNVFEEKFKTYYLQQLNLLESGEIVPARMKESITIFREWSDVDTHTQTLHSFINFLHTREREVLWRVVNENNDCNVDIEIGGRHIHIANLSQHPLSSFGNITNRPFKVILDSLKGVPHWPISQFYIMDNNVFWNAKLGIHHIEISADLSNPSEGGYINIRYFEAGNSPGVALRITFISSILKKLGMEIRIQNSGEGRQGSTILNAVFDKDHGAKNLAQLVRCLEFTIRVMHYSADLDLHFQDLKEQQQHPHDTHAIVLHMAQIFLAEGGMPFYSRGQIGLKTILDNFLYYLESNSRDQLLKSLNRILKNFRLPIIPVENPFGQKIIDDFFTRPIELALAHRQLIYAENNEISVNPNYNPTNDLLHHIASNEDEALQLGALLATLPKELISYATVGSVGKLTMITGEFIRLSGEWILIHGLWDPATERIVYAKSFTSQDSRSLSINKFIDVMAKEGYTVKRNEPLSIALKKRARSLLYATPDIISGPLKIQGIPASPGTQGPVFGQVTFDRHLDQSNSRSKILILPYTTPNDLESIQSAHALITTEGSLLSHASITTREYGIPSLILGNAEWLEVNEKPLLKIAVVKFTPPTRTAKGLWISQKAVPHFIQIQEGDVVIVDGKEGTIQFFENGNEEEMNVLLKQLAGVLNGSVNGKKMIQWLTDILFSNVPQGRGDHGANSTLIGSILDFLMTALMNVHQLKRSNFHLSVIDFLVALEKNHLIPKSLRKFNSRRKDILYERAFRIQSSLERIKQTLDSIKTLTAADRAERRLMALHKEFLGLVLMTSSSDKGIKNQINAFSHVEQRLRNKKILLRTEITRQVKELLAHHPSVKDLPKIRQLIRSTGKNTGPPKKILLACTGNTDRSPMAEALLKNKLKLLGIKDITIVSRGIYAEKDVSISKDAQTVLAEKSIHHPHFSAPLMPQDIMGTDLILGMTQHHVDFIKNAFPDFRGKVLRLKEFSPTSTNGDIDDPVGKDLNQYRATLSEIDSALEGLVESIKLDIALQPLVNIETSLTHQKATHIQASKRFIYPLGEVDQDYAFRVGGKSAHLGEILQVVKREGAHVPVSLSISTLAFDRFLQDTPGVYDEFTRLTKELDILAHQYTFDRDEKTQLKMASLSHKIRSLILSTEFRFGTDGLGTQILNALQAHGMENQPLAIRSSAVQEDTTDAAFAGAAESFLYVSHDDLFESIKNCWKSFFLPRGVLYRAHNGISPSAVQPAVLIQKMEDSDVSGVLFTINPATTEEEIIINASYGLAEPIVAGLIEGDTYRLDKNTGMEIDFPKIGSKREKLISGNNKKGTHSMANSPYERNRPALSQEQLRQLVKTAVALENYFGYPLDIEFSFSKDHLAILQTRPITALNNTSDNPQNFKPNTSATSLAPGAWGVWKSVGITHLPTIGLLESFITSAIAFLLLVNGMPESFSGNFLSLLTSVTQLSMIGMGLGIPLLILFHRFFGVLLFNPSQNDYEVSFSWKNILLATKTAASSLVSIPFITIGLLFFPILSPLSFGIITLGVVGGAWLHAHKNAAYIKSLRHKLLSVPPFIQVSPRPLDTKTSDGLTRTQRLLENYFLGSKAAPVGFDVIFKAPPQGDRWTTTHFLMAPLSDQPPLAGENEFIHKCTQLFTFNGQESKTKGRNDLIQIIENAALPLNETTDLGQSQNLFTVQKMTIMLAHQLKAIFDRRSKSEDLNLNEALLPTEVLMALLHQMNKSFLIENGDIPHTIPLNVAQAMDLEFSLNTSLQGYPSIPSDLLKHYAQTRAYAHQIGLQTTHASLTEAIRRGKPLVINISELFHTVKNPYNTNYLKGVLNTIKTVYALYPESNTPIGLTIQDFPIGTPSLNTIADPELRETLHLLLRNKNIRILIGNRDSILEGGKLSAKRVSVLMGGESPVIYTLKEEDWVETENAILKILISIDLVRNATSQIDFLMNTRSYINIQA